jgi:putative oxidoreductase
MSSCIAAIPRRDEDCFLEGKMGSGLSHGSLLAARLLLAACFLPTAAGRVTNISGFAASLGLKGMPYPDAAATLIILAEFFGPLALVLGLAPRITAFVLIAATLVTTGSLHRFWEYGGLTRSAEQAVFVAHLGVLAGLLLYAVTGPGPWSWQALWHGTESKAKKAPPKKKRPRSTTPKPRPKPAVPHPADDDYADAA